MRCHGVIGEFLDASYRIVEVERSASASGETGQLCGTAPTISQALVAAIDLRHERVDDEWSFVETMRHLVYATDAWASRTILDQPLPYHRIALPQTAYPPADAAALGMDLEASPSYAEVMAVRAERMALVRALVDGLTDDDLERGCTRAPAPGYPEELRTVASCLGVVMEEECEHHRYAMRDLAVLEARCPFSTLPPKFPANTGQSRSLSRRPQELSEGWSSFRA